MTQNLIFEGQPIQYNHETHTAYLTISEPFYSAGKKLGWDRPDPGIGINKSIIEFIERYKAHLVIKVIESGHYYWIYYETLKEFLEKNNCDYTVSGKTLKVISWKKFIRLTEHLEV